jgi:hypothetical protein
MRPNEDLLAPAFCHPHPLTTNNPHSHTTHTPYPRSYHQHPTKPPTQRHQREDVLPLHRPPLRPVQNLHLHRPVPRPRPPRHDRALSRQPRRPHHRRPPFNTVYILHDGGDKFTRREAILHTAGMAVKNVACFLAGNPGESATGSAAIRVILLKVDIPDFVEWWGKTGEERGVVSARCAELLRDLEDAAALVGECGEYRPEVRFVLPTCMLGEPGVGFAAERSIDQ